MSEKQIVTEEFFTLIKTKPAKICKVAHCTNKVRKGYATLCQRHHMQLWRARNPTSAAYANLRSSARRRKLEFALSIEEFSRIVNGTGYIENSGTHSGCYQIDRKDACLGYVPGNIHVLTISENTAKGNVERRNAEYIRQLLIRKGYTVEEPEEEEWNPYGGRYEATYTVEAETGDPF
jgi:hypothetical protein